VDDLAQRGGRRVCCAPFFMESRDKMCVMLAKNAIFANQNKPTNSEKQNEN
jgi:hypothetical protein